MLHSLCIHTNISEQQLLPSLSCYSPRLKAIGGLGSVVGIATGYRLGGPGIKSWWVRDFPHLSSPGAHPASCTMGTRSFLGVKSGWGMTLTPHPLLVPWSWKSRESYTSAPPMGRTACTEPQCRYKGALFWKQSVLHKYWDLSACHHFQ